MKSDRHIPAPGVQLNPTNGRRHNFVVTDTVAGARRTKSHFEAWSDPRWQTVHGAKRAPQRALIVGADAAGRRLAEDLVKHFPQDFHVVGLVGAPSDAKMEAIEPAASVPCSKPVFEGFSNIRDVIRQQNIDRVMFANPVERELEGTGLTMRRRQDRRGPVRQDGERRREVKDLQEDATSLAFNAPQTLSGKIYNSGKRAFDILVALVGLAIFGPIMALIYPILKITSPGPVFYKQERVGLNGKTFTIFKVRTMKLDAEKNGPMLSPHGDTRGTLLGPLLRKSKLDECPQFWNVLKGEMGVVGPRPERPHYTEPFSDHIFSYSLRHSVRPGLTGLAQIRGDHLTHVYIKLHYDLIYVTHRSPLMDLSILVQTPYTILKAALSKKKD